jgi:hypothetical protein
MTGTAPFLTALVMLAMAASLGSTRSVAAGPSAPGARCAGSPVASAIVAPGGAGAMLHPSIHFNREPTASSRAPAGVVLAGVVLPHSAGPGARDRLASRLASFAGSPALVYGERIRLDRRDRVTGQVVVTGSDGGANWLQALLVSEGLALVSDDAGRCTAALLAAEASARTAGRGVFAQGDFGETANQRRESLPGYLIFEGRVISVGKTASTTYLNFGHNRLTDVTVRISRRTSADFPAENSIAQLNGAVVRVRGWANERDGIDMALTGPNAIQIIEEQRDSR